MNRSQAGNEKSGLEGIFQIVRSISRGLLNGAGTRFDYEEAKPLFETFDQEVIVLFVLIPPFTVLFDLKMEAVCGQVYKDGWKWGQARVPGNQLG